MNLKTVLDDLTNDINNNQLSTEEIVPANADISCYCGCGSLKLSETTLNTMNKMFDLILLKDSIQTTEKVSKSLAQEMFTMLPLTDNYVRNQEAKLTTNPSIVNKDVVNKIMETNIELKISADLFDKLMDIRTVIDENSKKHNEILAHCEVVDGYYAEYELNFKDQPKMMYLKGEVYDIMKTPIKVFLEACYDDCAVKEHREQFYRLLTEVIYHSDIATLSEGDSRNNLNSGYNISFNDQLTLEDFTLAILYKVPYNVKDAIHVINRRYEYLQGLSSSSTLNKEIVQELNEINYVIEKMAQLNAFYECTHKKNNIFECLNKLLNLIK